MSHTRPTPMSSPQVRSPWLPVYGLATLLLAAPAVTHLGGKTFPIYELPSSSLPDVHDGSLADWEATLQPSVTQSDFIARHLRTSATHVPAPADQVEMDVYLAWHWATQRLFVAVKRVDASHVARLPTLIPATSDNQGGGVWSYDHVAVYVDGDHSGGVFQVWHFPPTESVKDTNNLQAQKYLLVAEATGPRTITAESYFPEWALAPPFADGAGFRREGLPSFSGYELYLTAWDELRPDLARSRPSRLQPGATIGFEVDVFDYDDTFDWEAYLDALSRGPTDDAPLGYYNVAGMHKADTADYFVDGLLVPCEVEDCSARPSSPVESVSWSRIKVGLAR